MSQFATTNNNDKDDDHNHIFLIDITATEVVLTWKVPTTPMDTNEIVCYELQLKELVENSNNNNNNEWKTLSSNCKFDNIYIYIYICIYVYIGII